MRNYIYYFIQRYLIRAPLMILIIPLIFIIFNTPLFLIASIVLWGNPFIIEQWSGLGRFCLAIWEMVVIYIIVCATSIDDYLDVWNANIKPNQEK